MNLEFDTHKKKQKKNQCDDLAQKMFDQMCDRGKFGVAMILQLERLCWYHNPNVDVENGQRFIYENLKRKRGSKGKIKLHWYFYPVILMEFSVCPQGEVYTCILTLSA